MATKSAAPAAPPAVAASAAATAGATPTGTAAPPAAGGGGLSAWLPAIATILLAPVATWAAVEFVVLPRLQKKMTAAPAVAETAVAEATGSHGSKGGKEKGTPSYEFSNVVVNLAGTMGTRYLKTSFLVTGPEPGLKAIFDGDKPRLTDVTLNVLSSLTLADLEEPGAKNVLREKLVAAYNQALGRKVAEQVYFSDFVVQ